MILPKKYHIDVISNEMKCCICLSTTSESSPSLFPNERMLTTYSDMGKIMHIVLSFNERILTRYCCTSCMDKIISCFNDILDINVAAQLACRQKELKGLNDSLDASCSKCSRVLSTVDEFTDHFKQHVLEVATESPPPLHTTRSITRKENQNSSQEFVHSTHSEDTEINEMYLYDYCEVVDGRSDLSSSCSISQDNNREAEDDWLDKNEEDSLEKNNSRRKGNVKLKRKRGRPPKAKSARYLCYLKDDKIPHLCHECGKSYGSLQSLKCHLRSHDPNYQGSRKKRKLLGSRLCDKCGKSFTSVETLRLHRQKHETMCSVCGKNIYKKYMKRHLMLHDNSLNSILPDASTLDATPLNCNHCDKSYSDRFMLVNHMVLMHGGSFEKIPARGKRRGLECSVCGLLLPSGPKLKRHKFEEHGVTGEDRIQCEVCDRWYSSKMCLRKHIKVEHMKATPYSCKLCPKVFKRYQGLWAHMRTHEDLRPYECGVCQVRYRQRYEVVNHLGKHVRAGDITLKDAFARTVIEDEVKGKIQTGIIYLKDQKVKEVSELTLLLVASEGRD